ncbi:MAG: hypothetical protein FWF03_05275, partial [Defluviitaleaceae bacterium]|nr:hypothetical protein [Defluviitaleaceae bacterium]
MLCVVTSILICVAAAFMVYLYTDILNGFSSSPSFSERLATINPFGKKIPDADQEEAIYDPPVISPAADEAKLQPEVSDIFSSIDNYDENKLSEYYEFMDSNGGLDAEDVVWMVNARLNKTMYADFEIHPENGFPLLVNPYNRLHENYAPPALEAIDAHGRLATVETIEAFNEMRRAAIEAGFDIAVQSAYRTF